MSGYIIIKRVNYPSDDYKKEDYDNMIKSLKRFKHLKYDGWEFDISPDSISNPSYYFTWDDDTDFNCVMKFIIPNINVTITKFSND